MTEALFVGIIIFFSGILGLSVSCSNIKSAAAVQLILIGAAFIFACFSGITSDLAGTGEIFAVFILFFSLLQFGVLTLLKYIKSEEQ